VNENALPPVKNELELPNAFVIVRVLDSILHAPYDVEIPDREDNVHAPVVNVIVDGNYIIMYESVGIACDGFIVIVNIVLS
jgi:hypothetical protein